MGSFDGRVALITGAASMRGQGAAEGRLLAGEGATVVLADVSDEEGARTAASIGERASYVRLDVTDDAQWDAVVQRIVEEHGRIDVLVNNAGVWHAGTLADTSPADFRRVVEINQVGVFLGMRAVAPVMRAAGTGSIVNVSSNASLRVALPNLAGGKAQSLRGEQMGRARDDESGGARARAVRRPRELDPPGPNRYGDDRRRSRRDREGAAAAAATPDEIAAVVCSSPRMRACTSTERRSRSTAARIVQ